MKRQKYWNEEGFDFTRFATLKVFWWAIVHSEHGIQDCLWQWRCPRIKITKWYKYFKSKHKEDYYYRLDFIPPLKLDIPTYLIHECGEKVLGIKDWDIPF